MAENTNKKKKTENKSHNQNQTNNKKKKNNDASKKTTSKKTKVTNTKNQIKEKASDKRVLITEKENNDIMVEDNQKVENNSLSEKTKIFMILVILAVFVCGIVGLLLAGQNNTNKQSKESNTASFEEFKTAWESDKLSVVYFMSSECGYCEMESPILEQISDDYQFDYIKLDATELSENDLSEVISLLGIEGATPTTVLIKNNEVIATQQGYLDGHDYVEFFVNSGLLEQNSIYKPEEYLTFIDFATYKELVDDNKLNIITIGQTACSHCAVTRPILSEIANECDITINYLDLRRISQDEQTEFFEMLDEMNYDDESYVEDGSFGTPLTIITKNGKIVSYVSGSQEKSSFVSEFEKVGIIK